MPGELRVSLRNEYFGFIWPSVFGMAPNGMWWASALIPIIGAPSQPSSWWLNVLGAVGIVAFLFVVLIAPFWLPILVLRARQPRGAAVVASDEAISEWDGPWRRAHVPWSRARIAVVRWTEHVRVSAQIHRAVQVRDAETDAVITFWSTEPKGAPISRRRVYAIVRDMAAIEGVLATHDHALRKLASGDADFTYGTPDWALAVDRPRLARAVRFGRIGYGLAFAAPLLSLASVPAAIALALAAASLLVLRAWPVLAEHAGIQASLAAATSADETTALRWRRRAARAEAAIRLTFVALTLASTALWSFALSR